MSARLRIVLAGLLLFGVLVLRQQASPPAPVSSECASPPGRALGSAARIAAHNDQRAAVTLADPVGVQVAEGAWLVAGRDRARLRAFRVEGGGLVWSATELPARSTDAKTVLRCMHADPETGGVGS